MSKWNYPGFPPYLLIAAGSLGLPTAIVDRARRSPELHRLSSLVAQTVDALPDARGGILDEAEKSLLALELAADAGRLILADARGAHAEPVAAADPESPDPSAPVPARRGPGRPRKDS